MKDLQEQKNQVVPETPMTSKDPDTNSSRMQPGSGTPNDRDPKRSQGMPADTMPKPDKDPFVMFETDTPVFIPPKKKGGYRRPTEKECYEKQGVMLKFKHDKHGEYKFFISLWRNDMEFYFSYEEFEKHRQLHRGAHTHHMFKEFEWALTFYRRRFCYYKCKYTEADLWKEMHLFRDPELGNTITMTW